MTELFQQTPSWIWWLVLSILLLILEIFVPTFVLVWFALGALLAVIVALIPGLGDQIAVQAAFFGLGSLAGLALLRPYLRSRTDTGADARELNDAETNMLGATGVLTQAIEGGQGRARVGDTTWTVTGPDLPVKTRIRVTSVEGIKLGVKADDAY